MGESITSANKALAIEAITGAFIKRDTTIPGRLCVPDYKQHNPTIPNGSASIPGVIRALPPDFKYEMGLVVAGGGVCHDSRAAIPVGLRSLSSRSTFLASSMGSSSNIGM
jgi:hypothetical protein